MTTNYRAEFLRDAIAANPGQQWTTASVMGLMRADGVLINRAAARSLLADLTAAGVLARVDRLGRTHYVPTGGA